MLMSEMSVCEEGALNSFLLRDGINESGGSENGLEKAVSLSLMNPVRGRGKCTELNNTSWLDWLSNACNKMLMCVEDKERCNLRKLI